MNHTSTCIFCCFVRQTEASLNMTYRENKDGATVGIISQATSLLNTISANTVHNYVLFFYIMSRMYVVLHSVSNVDAHIFWYPKLLWNGSVIISHIGNKSSQEIGFEDSPHRAFISLQRWPVQMKALLCMLILSRVLHLLLMCCICRYLLLYITPTAPHITLHLLLISSFLTSIFPAPPPPVHPSARCHGRGASVLLPDAAIKALHLTQADTS